MWLLLMVSLTCVNSLTLFHPRVIAVSIMLGSSTLDPQALSLRSQVKSTVSVQQEYRYEDEDSNKELEREMKDRLAGSVLGSPGNSPAEDFIALLFKGLGTFRGDGMDDLKSVPNIGEGRGAFMTIVK